ncbi:TPA: DUF3165 family protein [Streptococcus suis]|uniref:DUF3165 family protein n=1 Tax=Streptococcus suis TaxID=1307 RepID=UPI000CF40AD3|nr:DUF3165 family protein [Streptococcus suis]MBY4985788.1 DUF3165 family protein [Streptococcus suis]MBY5038968.1 DUF3165 family protein [Streptococcus suis]MCK3881323.1 DUF3165 family protein [Streptococcus suis]MDW8759001.1 DUF3165 family protein [Streptococcus suis]NQN54298.1 DUF3165 family protein [Streptococcus suis]
MFYLILAIMLVLFYIFVAPKNVRGTINIILAVFVLVLLSIALVFGFLKIMQLSTEVWVGMVIVLIGLWALWDIHYLDRPSKRK